MILRFFVLDEYIIIIGIFVSSIKYTIILLDISNSLNENKILFLIKKNKIFNIINLEKIKQ